MIDFGDIWEAFQVLAKEGGLGVIHAEDNDIVMHMYAKLIRENRVSFHNLAEVHNQLSEDLSFRRILRLAESVPGTALYMMHVSARTGVEAIAEARRKGLPIYGETLHQYLLYSAEDYKRPNGQIYHTYPSLKSADDQKALWDGTASDVIHCVATDELCCTLKDKTIGNRIDDTTGGNSGVEPRLGVMYTEMVARRGYSLSRSSTWFRPMPPGLWVFIRKRAQSRSAATPISSSSTRLGGARFVPPTCTRPTTPLGKATTSSRGRS